MAKSQGVHGSKTWQDKLHADLAVVSYLNAAWRSSICSTKKKSDGISLSRRRVTRRSTRLKIAQQYDFTGRDVIESDGFSPNALNDSIDRLVLHKICDIDKTGYRILLPKNKLTSASLSSYLNAARSLLSDKLPTSRIAAEVFRFLCGDYALEGYGIEPSQPALRLDETVVAAFRRFSQECTDFWEKGEARTHDEFIKVLASSHGDLPISRRLATVFLETCAALASYRPQTGEKYLMRFRGRIDFFYVLQGLFGLPCNIPGLDFLFAGRLPYYGSLSNHTLIQGGSASCKTSLGSNIGFEVAQKGGVVVYLSLEEDLSILMNKYASFGWTEDDNLVFKYRRSFGDASDYNWLRDEASEARKEGKGFFLLVRSPASDVGQAMEIIESTAIAISDLYTSQKLIFLDSVNSIVSIENIEESRLRRATADCYERLRRNKVSLVSIAETGHDKNDEAQNLFSFLDRVCDTVITLSRHMEDDFKIRTLEISKSRLLPSVRGAHRFTIHKGQGVEVFPSAAAVASTRHSGRRLTNSKTPQPSGVEGFDELLGEEGFRANSITALVGDAGCGKAGLGLAWLAHGACEENQPGLYLSFQRGPNRFSDLYASRFPMAKERITRFQDQEASILETPVVHCMETLGLTSGEIISSIESWLRRCKKELHLTSGSGVGCFRIFMDGLAGLDEITSKSFDVHLVSALKEISKTENIGLFLSYSLDIEREEPSTLGRQISLACDNVLEFRRLEVEGMERIAAYTLKTTRCEHPRDPRELVVRNDNLALEQNFSLFADVRSGEARPIRVQIYLHEEGATQKRYNLSLEREIKNETTEDMHLHTETFPTLGALNIIKGRKISADIRLVQVDDPHLDVLEEEDLLTIPIDRVDGFEDLLESCKARILCEDRERVAALPYFVNLPLLVCDTSLEGVKVPVSVEKMSWQTFADWVDEFYEDPPKSAGENLLAFDYAKGSPESFNCLFLEILFSLGSKQESSAARGGGFSKYLSKHGKEALILFWRIAHHAYKRSILTQDMETMSSSDRRKSTGKKQQTGNVRYVEKAVYRRAWYSSLPDLRQIQKSQSLSTLPGGVVTLGTWYIVAPQCSAAPDITQHLMKELCCRDNAIDRFERGIGMPPFQSLYRGVGRGTTSPISFAANKLMRQTGEAIIRNKIPQYRNFARPLSFYLRRTLELGKSNVGFPKSSIERLFHQIQLLYSRLDGS